MTALAVGFALILAVLAGIVWSNVYQQQASELVRHTMEVESRLYSLQSLLEDAETGQRGYLLTSNESYLAPYLTATAALDGEFKKLAALISDNPRQGQAPELHRRPELESANNNPLKRKGDVDQQPYSRLEPVGLRQSSLESASASRATMELGRSMMSAGAGAARATGSSTTDRKICSTANNNPLKRKGDVDQQPYSRLEPVGLRQSSLESASASRARMGSESG